MSGMKDKQRTALIGGFLALVTLAVFWQVLKCDFINFDDDLYVTSNPHVQTKLTWAAISWAFHSTRASNWHPLTWISHVLDYQFYGLRPGGHHLSSLLFHIANTLLLFVWLRRLTGAVWRSALVAALFAWHPMHVESVAWVAERKDVLSTFFWMLTLLAFQQFKFHSLRFKVWYGLALVFFILGLLAKPMLVTLPFVLLLVDFWTAELKQTMPVSRLPWKRLLLEKIPFFALAAISCLVTFIAQRLGGAVVSMEKLPFGERLANAIVSYVRYLGKMFWPDDLAIIYPFLGAWSGWQVAGALMVLLAVSWLVLKLLQRRPYLAVGWFWFLGTLVPVIGLVQVGSQTMADRYAYVPFIGLFIMLAWGLAEFAEGTKRRREVVGASALALAGCLFLTWRQVGYWRDSEALFKHAIAATGDNFVACSNLGGFLMAHNKPDEAIHYFGEALRMYPQSADAHANLGEAMVEQGNAEQGVEHLVKALELEPNQIEAHFDLGKALAKQGKTPDAITEFREAVRLRPDWTEARQQLVLTLAAAGDLAGAVAEMSAIAQADPANPQPQAQLAALFSQQHQLPEAISHYREAVRLYHAALHSSPDSPQFLNNLAWLLATNPNAEIRNGPEAVTLARHACEATGWKYAIMAGTLAAAQAESGQFEEALKSARQAQEIALAANEPQIAARNEELSKQYQAGKTYRESN
ncbi:MAG: Tetratricopeptide 2 repeat protein [Pedosphaera sp.]|nr:Tetratricopeptide 2 repeat protein [Pedosphaera sp.]